MIKQKRTYASFWLKDESVRLAESEPQKAMLEAAAREYAAERQRLVVTSANDGAHMEGSEHYEDDALDLRVWHVEDHERLARRLQDRLGAAYDVIAEWRKTDEGEVVPSHVHMEKDRA